MVNVKEDKLNESLEEEGWEKVVESWRASGLSQVEFCRKSKIKASKFYYWRRRVEGIKRKRQTKKKTSLQKVRREVSEAEFIEIKIPDAPSTVTSNSQMLRITTSYGATLEFPL